jgi:hypothetical protein
MREITTAQQIADVVLGNLPYVRCFPCLSAQAAVVEKKAREAAQLLVVRNEFCIDWRTCQICRRTDRVLVSGKTTKSRTMDRPSRSDVILRKLDNGDLPRRLPGKMDTGSGSGAPCDACGGRIQPHHIEYEWGYPDQSRVFRMHLGCVGLWQALRRKRGLDQAV